MIEADIKKGMTAADRPELANWPHAVVGGNGANQPEPTDPEPPAAPAEPHAPLVIGE